jgi:hypothetical protein
MSKWIINPTVDMPSVLESYGRFLEDDYRMLIESLRIPDAFDEYSEKTNRRFIIVGGKENPGVIAKSVFLCIKLAGPESVSVLVTNLDEMFLVQNVFDNYAKGIQTKLFATPLDLLSLSNDWRNEVDKATDIVVYGDEEMIKQWREYETVDRHIWEHGEYFSLGIVKAESLTYSMINEICFDFFCYYGEGRLAPKFYFILGIPTKKMFEHFAKTLAVNYAPFIEAYRDKLPFTRKSDLTREVLGSNYYAKYVREFDLKYDELDVTLYGDVRLAFVDSISDIEEFLKKWRESISTVAVDWDDDELLDIAEEHMIPRICRIGDMQFPEFFEQSDALDDFTIYVSDDLGNDLL